MNCYFGWITDDEILRNSSSGGIFTALAENILAQDGVIYGASIDYSTSSVCHIRVESEELLTKLRGSKYQQSYIGHTYKQACDDLKTGRKVLFTGTPCQISGLYNFIKINKAVRGTENLITVELLCHGVTNKDIIKKYLKSVAGNRKISFYEYRTKKRPWYHSGSSVHIRFENGKEIYKNHSIDPFYIAFNNNLILRPSCFSCPFARKENRVADITLGDFWGAEEYIEEKNLLNKGVGLILTNSSEGEEILQLLISKGVVRAKPLDFEKAVPRNGALIKPARANPYRECFLKRIQTEDFCKVINSLYRIKILKNRIILLIGYDNVRRLKGFRKVK